MTDAEYKAQQAEAKSKVKNLQSIKNRTPEQTKQLKKLQIFRTSPSPSKKAQVKKNIGSATDIALTGLSLVPGLGALGLGARAIMKGVQAGKTLYKVGNKTFKSKDAAVAAAKKIKAPLSPKAKGNLSPQARGRERITRLADQAKKTPSVRGAATKGITKTAAQKAALKTSAKRFAAGAGGLAAITPLSYVAIKDMKRPKSHKVTGGQNLSSIAKKYNTTIKALMKANPSIENANIIRVGQKIKLPFFGQGKDPYKGMSKSRMAKLHKETQARKAANRKKAAKVVKRAGGGRMNTDELHTAEMRSAGKDLHQPQSEIKKRIKKETRYASLGGKVGGQDYRDREDESIAIRLGKGKATKKNPRKAAKERNLSYGKRGHGTRKGKINRSGGDAYVAKGYA